MKRKNIKNTIRTKLDNYFESITDKSLVMDMKKDILVTGGSIASMLIGEDVKDYDIYFKTKETTVKVAKYYCNVAKENKIANMYVLTSDSELVKEVLKLNIDWITEKVKDMIHYQKENGVVEEDEELSIDTPLEKFEGLLPSSKTNGLSLRLLHNIYNTFKHDENRIKIYSSGSFGTVGKVESDKIDSQEIDGEDEGKYEVKFISANAITLSDKVQLVTRFYGCAEEIHKNFDFVHATGVYDYDINELTTTTEQLESLLNKNLVYKGSLYPLASIFRARKFIYRGWTIDAGQYLKMAFQLNAMDLLDPYVLEEQLTGVDLLYFYQIISDLKYKELTNDNFKPSTEYFISIIEKVFE